jgi:hypothetical protein
MVLYCLARNRMVVVAPFIESSRAAELSDWTLLGSR